ncbi:MAG: hypothetical protein ABIQ99_06485 [Thermoflexales bacterium]
MSIRVAFSVIGGPHQVFHIVPVAATLSLAMPEAKIFVFASDERSLELAEQAASFYPGAYLRYRLLRRSSLGDMAAGLWRHSSLAKIPLLWRNRRLFNTFDVIVVAECTSTILRRMGVNRPRLFCIPHGAGDRAVSFETRFRRFDRIGVAGEKTAERMIESHVRPESVKIVGYPKGDLIRRMSVKPVRLFDNARPTVLYNPHFKRKLSSLHHAREIVRAFAADGRFNLIVAPHIRVFDDASARILAEWAAMSVPDRIMVDTGTDRLFDMSYCVSADIYLGDISSQVYEFLFRPRPCVFLNSHGVNWTESPDYAFWRLGEVVDPAHVIGAIERAQSIHAQYLPAQRLAVSMTFAQFDDPCGQAAREIISCAAEPATHEPRWGAPNSATLAAV